MDFKIDDNKIKNETVQLTLEAKKLSQTPNHREPGTSSQKWLDFLNEYRAKNQQDFDWVTFVKNSRASDKNFDLRQFILTHGQDAIDSFLECKHKIIQQRKNGQNNLNQPSKSKDSTPAPTQTEAVTSPATAKQVQEIMRLQLRNSINELRYRLLIDFITPQTRLDKKSFKKWMKVCQKDGLTIREAYEQYVLAGSGALKEKPTRQRLLQLLEDEKNMLDQEISNINQSKIIGITTTIINEERKSNTTPEKTVIEQTSQPATKTHDYQSKEVLEEIKKIEL